MGETICESKSPTQRKELDVCKKAVSVGELGLLTGKDWQELFSPSTEDTMAEPRRNQDDWVSPGLD